MTDTPSIPQFSGTDADKDHLLLQDDVQQILDDTSASYLALGLLAKLLQNGRIGPLDGDEVSGLAMLLEIVHSRLFLALNGLEVISQGFLTPAPSEG